MENNSLDKLASALMCGVRISLVPVGIDAIEIVLIRAGVEVRRGVPRKILRLDAAFATCLEALYVRLVELEREHAEMQKAKYKKLNLN
ncbi:hypothetical protein SAMN04515674_101495 [Pseudarcicella hirudinis]|uniref:Uncharacterized protein n=1 Tax=Pseudarcicella hirudinis TaxID=1079859 RepID=A0A1I5MXL0_9BACT|nr:hypothetical protein [Pseudarcicella hirudinis]SFP14223.1 hypothetical protein SAMN04515674_101495 [Pseudarcicella hirudinis]